MTDGGGMVGGLGNSTGTINIDTSRARANVKRLADDLRGFEDATSTIADGIDASAEHMQASFERMAEAGDRIAQWGTSLTASITRPVIDMGFSMANLASDVAESTSAVRTVYGSAADSIIAHSLEAADAMGTSQASYLQGVTVLSAYAQMYSDLPAEQAAFSEGILQNAADLASFYNTTPEDAQSAIAAGLRGEGQALERYGIILNQANVEQYALTNGIWDGVTAMTNQQLVTARMGLIQEGMGAATGDFTRTIDGQANQSRILAAEIENLKAKFGEMLLPILVKLTDIGRGAVGFLERMSDRGRMFILIAAGIAAAIGPILIVLGTLISAIATVGTLFTAGGALAGITALLGPIALIVAALIGLGIAYRANFLGLADGVHAVVDGFKAFGNVMKQVWTDGDQLDKWMAKIPGPLRAVVELISAGVVFVRDLGRYIKETFNLRNAELGLYRFTGPLKDLAHGIGKVVDTVRDLYEAFKSGGLGGLLDAIPGELADLYDAFILVAKGIGGLLLDAFQKIDWTEVGRKLIQGLTALAGMIFDGLNFLAEKALEGLQAVDWAQKGRDLLMLLVNALTATVDFTLGIAAKIGSALLDKFKDARDWLVDKWPWLGPVFDAASDLWTFGVDLVANVSGTFKNALEGFWRSFKSFLRHVAGWVADFFGGDDEEGLSGGDDVGSGTMKMPEEREAAIRLSAFVEAMEPESRLAKWWGSFKSFLRHVVGWIADFFGGDESSGGVHDDIGTDTLISPEQQEARVAAIRLGAYVSAMEPESRLSKIWSSLKSLVGSVCGWITRFLGGGTGADYNASDYDTAAGSNVGETTARITLSGIIDAALGIASTLPQTLGDALRAIGGAAVWVGNLFDGANLEVLTQNLDFIIDVAVTKVLTPWLGAVGGFIGWVRRLLGFDGSGGGGGGGTDYQDPALGNGPGGGPTIDVEVGINVQEKGEGDKPWLETMVEGINAKLGSVTASDFLIGSGNIGVALDDGLEAALDSIDWFGGDNSAGGWRDQIVAGLDLAIPGPPMAEVFRSGKWVGIGVIGLLAGMGAVVDGFLRDNKWYTDFRGGVLRRFSEMDFEGLEIPGLIGQLSDAITAFRELYGAVVDAGEAIWDFFHPDTTGGYDAGTAEAEAFQRGFEDRIAEPWGGQVRVMSGGVNVLVEFDIAGDLGSDTEAEAFCQGAGSFHYNEATRTCQIDVMPVVDEPAAGSLANTAALIDRALAPSLKKRLSVDPPDEGGLRSAFKGIEDTAAASAEAVRATFKRRLDAPDTSGFKTAFDGIKASADVAGEGIKKALSKAFSGGEADKGAQALNTSSPMITSINATKTAFENANTAIATATTGIARSSTTMRTSVTTTVNGMAGETTGRVRAWTAELVGLIDRSTATIKADIALMALDGKREADRWQTGVVTAARTLQTDSLRAVTTMHGAVVRELAGAATEGIREFDRLGRDGSQRLRDRGGQARDAGYYVGDMASRGVADGMNDALWRVTQAVDNIVNEVDRGMKSKLLIKSPSGKTRYIGQMTTLGVAVGQEDMIPSVVGSVNKVVGAVVDTYRRARGLTAGLLGDLATDTTARGATYANAPAGMRVAGQGGPSASPAALPSGLFGSAGSVTNIYDYRTITQQIEGAGDPLLVANLVIEGLRSDYSDANPISR